MCCVPPHALFVAPLVLALRAAVCPRSGNGALYYLILFQKKKKKRCMCMRRKERMMGSMGLGCDEDRERRAYIIKRDIICC